MSAPLKESIRTLASNPPKSKMRYVYIKEANAKIEELEKQLEQERALRPPVGTPDNPEAQEPAPEPVSDTPVMDAYAKIADPTERAIFYREHKAELARENRIAAPRAEQAHLAALKSQTIYKKKA